jgi:hypothetical protein
VTLPAFGVPLSLEQIRAEFGGGYPISLSQYYAGGGRVPPGTVGYPNGGGAVAIPGGGTISINNFYGASNYVPPPIVYNGNIFWQNSFGMSGYSAYEGFGAIDPNTFPPYGGAFIIALKWTGGQLDLEISGNQPNDDAHWKTMAVQDWGTIARGAAGFTYIGGATNTSRWRWLGQSNPFTGAYPKTVQFT